MDGLKYMQYAGWEKIGHTCEYGIVSQTLFGDLCCVTGAVVWTLPLQDPRHREEKEASFSITVLNYGLGEHKYWFLANKIFVSERVHKSTQLAQLQA